MTAARKAAAQRPHRPRGKSGADRRPTREDRSEALHSFVLGLVSRHDFGAPAVRRLVRQAEIVLAGLGAAKAARCLADAKASVLEAMPEGTSRDRARKDGAASLFDHAALRLLPEMGRSSYDSHLQKATTQLRELGSLDPHSELEISIGPIAAELWNRIRAQTYRGPQDIREIAEAIDPDIASQLSAIDIVKLERNALLCIVGLPILEQLVPELREVDPYAYDYYLRPLSVRPELRTPAKVSQLVLEAQHGVPLAITVLATNATMVPWNSPAPDGTTPIDLEPWNFVAITTLCTQLILDHEFRRILEWALDDASESHYGTAARLLEDNLRFSTRANILSQADRFTLGLVPLSPADQLTAGLQTAVTQFAALTYDVFHAGFRDVAGVAGRQLSAFVPVAALNSNDLSALEHGGRFRTERPVAGKYAVGDGSRNSARLNIDLSRATLRRLADDYAASVSGPALDYAKLDEDRQITTHCPFIVGMGIFGRHPPSLPFAVKKATGSGIQLGRDAFFHMLGRAYEGFLESPLAPDAVDT